MSRSVAEAEVILSRLEREEQTNPPAGQNWQVKKLHQALRNYAAAGDLESAYEVGAQSGLTSAQVDHIVAGTRPAETPAPTRATFEPVDRPNKELIHQFRRQTMPQPKPSPLASPGPAISATARFNAALDRYIASGLSKTQAMLRLVHQDPELHRAMLSEVNGRHIPAEPKVNAVDLAAITRWQTMLAADMDSSGRTRKQAVARLVAAQPSLHAAYLVAINR